MRTVSEIIGEIMLVSELLSGKGIIDRIAIIISKEEMDELRKDYRQKTCQIIPDSCDVRSIYGVKIIVENKKLITPLSRDEARELIINSHKVCLIEDMLTKLGFSEGVK